MKASNVRILLLGLFAGSLAIQLFSVFMVRKSLWPDELQSLSTRILGVHSAQLGIILGVIFARKQRKPQKAPPGLEWMAIGLTILWIVIVGWRPVSLLFVHDDDVKEVLAYLDAVSAASSFIVASALTFFFTRPSEGGGAD